MGAISFKCPYCGGELVFDPASQKYACPYCAGTFSQEQLDAMTPKEGEEVHEQAEEEAEAAGAAGQTAEGSNEGEAVYYICPSCGAEIVTEETTAATFCYYCHNPVVLKGRVSGQYLPDSIIPFKIDKKEAKERFERYIRSKKFVPKAFYDGDQIEKLTGVYYPYWLYDTRVGGELSASARNVRIWRSGETEYTETSIYQVERGGLADIMNMSRNALKDNHRDLAERVQPYELKDVQPFSMGYLSGFVAERRNMEQEEFRSGLRADAEQYTERLLRDTISGYSSVSVQSSRYDPKEENWKYTLFPVWVLTYTKGERVYYYLLNGQTGKVTGKLPIDTKKLAIWSLVLMVIAFVAALAVCYFVFS